MVDNLCGSGSTNPYCTCTDYYGHIHPEYRHFDKDNGNYYCCNNSLNFKINTASTSVINYLDTVNLPAG